MDILSPPQFTLTRYYTTDNPLHLHRQWEVCLFTQGSTEQAVNEKISICAPGDVFILGPSHTHKLKPLQHPHGHQDVYFSDEEIKQIFNEYSPTLYESAKNGVLHFHLPPMETNVVLSALQSISLLRFDSDPTLLESCVTIKRSILHYLIGQYLLQQLHETKESFPPWFYKLLSQLQDPEFFCLPVGEIIKTTGYSHSQFSLLFKKYANTSLIDYLMTKRLEYATELLTQTNKSTLDVCMSVGYESYSFFLKNFKKKYSATPLQYRKNHKKAQEQEKQ